MKNDDFDLVNLPIEAQDPEIKAEDFTLQRVDGSIHEQKFQTKPTTFLKDSLKRFSKNKSSVVAAYILGILILLSIFVPIFNTNDVSKAANSAYSNLEPKLFDSGTGWWDGTKHVDHCPVDAVTLMPDPELYLEGGVTNKVVEGEQYTNEANVYGKEGYFQIGYYGTSGLSAGYIYSQTVAACESSNYFALNLSEVTLTVTDFDVCDLDKITYFEGKRSKKGYKIPENFDLGEVSLEFVYVNQDEEVAVEVISPSVVHNIGLKDFDHNEPVVINDTIINAFGGKILYEDFYFRFKVARSELYNENENVCSLIRSFQITPSFVSENYPSKERVNKYFSKEVDSNGVSGISFSDAMQCVCRQNKVGTGANTKNNIGYWGVFSLTKIVRKAYMGRCVFASFDYDSYKATLGPRVIEVTSEKFNHYKKKGWVDFNFKIKKIDGKWQIDVNDSHFRPFSITNKNRCPVLETFNVSQVVVDQEDVGGENIWSVNVKVLYYKFLDENATEMPKFLFGTDKSGRDMFKYVFDGLKWSLLIGLVTFLVCFTFGLIWGAVSGYFGGTVDLIMERFTDVLSGIPWIVVMTLIILKAGESSFGVFVLALCLTGWIGTASTTRTQFYRFRGREYVLASRTLGASDARLIGKHILPNALGTIITGAVLMIPSVIFSEATISYLGLGFKNLSSLGVILSNNQSELTNHPYQLIFPSVVIALVMISFNLFGNGLRDAINPSLKGEDE